MRCRGCAVESHVGRRDVSDADPRMGDRSGSVSRRGFVGGLLAACFALLPLPVLAKKKLAILLSKLGRLKRVGGYTIARIRKREVLFIRKSKEEVVAIHAICPHRRTRLRYDKKSGRIVCPNHGSVFTLDGRKLKGPAKRDLSPRYDARLDAKGQRVLLTLPD